MPTTFASGKIFDNSIAMQPEPVPKSKILFGFTAKLLIISMSCSVSGLGISTAGDIL